MLIDLLEHVPEKPYQIILPAQLVVRDTCGATQV
jgi:DNA-binding LacI/PurR family transcriptional regulator